MGQQILQSKRTGTITATGGTIGGFTISNNSLYNGLDTINHKEGTNETAGVNISVLGGFSAYNGEYGTEMNNGQIRFYSLGRELGYITPGSTDFSDYSKTGIGIVATNQIGGAGLYGRIDLGYKDKMNGNTYIAAYSVCCDGKKNSNDGFNSTFHIKTLLFKWHRCFGYLFQLRKQDYLLNWYCGLLWGRWHFSRCVQMVACI